MNIRQERILEILNQGSAISTLDLAREFKVSDQTIRRDLKTLAEEGAVEKFHGGVRLRSVGTEAPFQQRLRTNARGKELIARACEALIPDGATLFLDNSSTACFLARLLARRKGLTIATLSVQSAHLLAEGGENNRVILPGGELRTSDMTIVGARAIDFLARLSPDFFIMSVAGLSVEQGCMDFDLYEAEYKHQLLENAGEVVLLADSSKYGQFGLVRSCGLDAIDLFIGDTVPPPDLLSAISAQSRVVITDSGI